MMQAFLDRADWTRDIDAYCKGNCIDPVKLQGHAGIIAIVAGHIIEDGSFMIDDGGSPHVVIEALDQDAATTIDLVAWPINRPDIFATVYGRADVLGVFNLCNPASWVWGAKLKVHRTPLAWLQGEGMGAVVLDHRSAGITLRGALGPLVAEDVAHGQFLENLVRPKDGPKIILARSSLRSAA